MADKKPAVKYAEIPGSGKDKVIPYGSAQHEAMLELGYGFDRETAEKIIAERDENPMTWPLDEYKRAKAFLAALNSAPVAISDRQPWKRYIGRT